MLQSVIKYIFTIFCCVYVYKNLLHIKKFTTREVLLIPLAIIMSFIIALIKTHMPLLVVISLVIFIDLYCYFIYKKDFIASLTIITIAIGISYFIYALSVISLIPVTSILYMNINDALLLDNIGIILFGIVQNLIAILLFRIKRFKNGIPDINSKYSDTVSYLSILILLASSLIYQYIYLSNVVSILVFLTIMFGLTILLWWRKRISDKYINKVYERNIKILEETVETQKTEVENLSKIIHKDNKVLSALRIAVIEQSKLNVDNNPELQKLLTEIMHLEDERREFLTDYEQNTKTLPKTGVFATDMILGYLHKRSVRESILFDVTIMGDIPYMVTDAVDTYDLNTMIADLGENAIIATSGAPTKNILLIIGYRDNIAFFDIYDSGSNFDAEVIADIGKRRHTTHKDTGGSGIGLMTTYELINKYHATLEIEELDNNNLFTKRVSILFNNSALISIHSNRPEIIVACNTRNDIHLF